LGIGGKFDREDPVPSNQLMLNQLIFNQLIFNQLIFNQLQRSILLEHDIKS